jgi:hypothetical protein
LLAAAAANPTKQFDVLVQGNKGISSAGVGQDVTNANGKLKMRFLTAAGVGALVSGKDLLQLAKNPHVLSITPNATTKTLGYQDATMWKDSTDLTLMQNTFDPNTRAKSPALHHRPRRSRSSTRAFRRAPTSDRGWSRA